MLSVYNYEKIKVDECVRLIMSFFHLLNTFNISLCLKKSYRYKSVGEKIVLVGHSYKLVVYKGLNRVPQGVRAINIDIKNSCLDKLAL